MYSENGVLIDFDEIAKLIETAEVFGVAFAHFPERLIVDALSNEHETPFITVSEPKGSAQQRIAWLARRRPSLGKAQAFSLISWPHSTRLLEESGIWTRIRERVAADLEQPIDAQCNLALAELQDLDREALMALLRGDDCVTLWPPGEDSVSFQ